VAAFVGEADFLPGIVGADGIHTEIGILPHGRKCPRAGRVDVLVRPEHVKLVPDSAGEAVVTERRFRGAGILYDIRLRSGRRARSHQPSTHRLPIGTRVSVHPDLAAVAAFDALDAPESASTPPASVDVPRTT